MEPLDPAAAGRAMDAARLRAELDALDELPYGRERTARREDLVAYAEQLADPALLASALLSHADDCQEDGENQGMVVGFGRAWRIWQTRPEVFDDSLRFRFREHFQHVIDVLNEDERVPAAEVDRLMDEMEAFYRAGGYSLRAVYRSRYWIHRRRGQTDAATRCVEQLLAEDGDSGASCDACDLATAAYWYERQDDLPRAVDLWRTIIAGVRSCERPHVAIAHGEVMIDLLNVDQFDEARRHHRLGYPMIRRRRDLPRQLELHALFVNRTRDVVRGLEILHDHIDWLPADRHAVGDYWWVHGRFLLFLKLLVDQGHGDLPITRAGGRVTTASGLYDELDAVLSEFAAHQDAASGGTECGETLETWRGAKLRRDVLPPPEDEQPEAGWAAVAAPWDTRRGRGAQSGARAGTAGAGSLARPAGFEPLDTHLARARYLGFLRHPHADSAWECVAADGADLSAGIEAELAEGRAVAVARHASGLAEHAAAREAFAHAKQLYAALGRAMDSLRCEAWQVYETYLGGDQQDTDKAQAELAVLGHAEFELERASAAQLLAVLLPGLCQALDRWRRVVDLEPAVDGAAGQKVSDAGAARLREFSELAEQRGVPAMTAAGMRPWMEVTAAIGRMFARQGEDERAAEYRGNLIERLEMLIDLDEEVFQPWLAAEAELRRGQACLADGQAEEAERAARRVAARNSPPVAEQLPGPAELLLAEAIDAQGDRDEEVAEHAARAARLLAGADPVGAARARLLMGEVHYRAGRHERAEAFYHPALAGLAAHWDEEACRQPIHAATMHFAQGLRERGRPGDAVRVLGTVLASIPEDFAAARSWLLHSLAESAEAIGDGEAALLAYERSAAASRRAGGYQPAVASLESAARVAAPTDIRAAFRYLDEAVARLREVDDPATERQRGFLIGEARTLGLKYLVKRIETETIPDQDVAELLPSAQEAAEAGTREMWALLDAPRDGGERRDFAVTLESALKPLTLAIAVLRQSPQAAAQWHFAFAEACDRWGLPEFAGTARENGEYFAGVARDEQRRDGEERAGAGGQAAEREPEARRVPQQDADVESGDRQDPDS